MITEQTEDTEVDLATEWSPPPRSGQSWTEEDYAAIMAGARAGRSQEEIATQIGRTLNGLRGQLRNLLPLAERQLPVDLVLARLRQLDRDGEYDWLAAMVERARSPWELRAERREEQAARGFPALEDEEVLGLALALVDSRGAAQDELRSSLASEISRRGLGYRLRMSAETAADAAVDALLESSPDRRYEDARDAWSPEPSY